MKFRYSALILIAAGALGGFFLSGVQDAAAAKASIKFWAGEYRVYIVPGTFDGDGVLGEAAVTLKIKGRAAAYGGDKVDFSWEEPDAARWLPVLQVCGGGNGRLQGTISSQVDQRDRGITGKGPIDELNCRVILK
jgi:hypothetical protein